MNFKQKDLAQSQEWEGCLRREIFFSRKLAELSCSRPVDETHKTGDEEPRNVSPKLKIVVWESTRGLQTKLWRYPWEADWSTRKSWCELEGHTVPGKLFPCSYRQAQRRGSLLAKSVDSRLTMSRETLQKSLNPSSSVAVHMTYVTTSRARRTVSGTF